jgi:ABC-type multidrug transport system fused ATPase/permease subunit
LHDISLNTLGPKVLVAGGGNFLNHCSFIEHCELQLYILLTVVANVIDFLFSKNKKNLGFFWYYHSNGHRKATCIESFPLSSADAVRDIALHGASPWVQKTYETNPQHFNAISTRVISGCDLITGTLQVLELVGLPVLAMFSGDSVQLHTFNITQKRLDSTCANLTALRTLLQMIQNGLVPFAEKYYDCISKEMPECNEIQTTSKRPLNPKSIELRHLSFRYIPNEPDSEAKAESSVAKGKNLIPNTFELCDLSFSFEEGKVYSIVGKNGSGKSTLVHLLTKLLQPSSGQILVDGIDLDTISDGDWLSNVSVAPQTFSKLWEFSVRENIGLGATSLLEKEDYSLIEREAANLGISEFVDLDTYLGDKERSRNISQKELWKRNLSEGQWQYISLARAFVRESAKILILDEPSSSLDPAAEHKLFDRLWKKRKNRITIFISHSLQTCRASDCILVMDQGRIVQVGKHSGLISVKEGIYAKLTDLQNDSWR